MTTLAGLAGCGGGGDDEPGGDDTPGDDTPSDDETQTETESLLDDTFTLSYGRARPSEVHFNMYNPTGSLTQGINSPQQVMWDQLMVFNSKTSEWSNQLLSEFSVDGTTVTLEFDDSYFWNNGDPVTGQDFVTQISIGEYIGFAIWELIESAEATGERTVELTLSAESNPGIVREQVNRRLYVKDSEYRQWLEDLDNASGQDEVDNLVSELTSEWKYAAANSDTLPASNGPYQVDRITDQRVVLTRNEHYPVKTNVPEVEYIYMEGDQTYQAAMSSELDALGNVGANMQVRDQFADEMEYVDIPEFGVTALHMQLDHEWLGIREVRQAFAYLADTGRVATNSSPRLAELAATTHLSDGQTEAWMGDELDALTQYGPGEKTDEATAKMQEAGFTKEGGTWLDPDGNSMEFSIQTVSWPAPLGVAETISDQLSTFGIPTNVQQLEASQWISNYESGDFALRGGYFGGGPHPYFSFTALTSTVYQAANVPLEVELPPIGEPDGSPSTFDVQESLTDLAQATDDQEATDIVRQLCWYVNQYVPTLPLTNGFSPNYYGTDHWTFPSPDEDPRMYVRFPFGYMFKAPQDGSDQAVLQGKTE